MKIPKNHRLNSQVVEIITNFAEHTFKKCARDECENTIKDLYLHRRTGDFLHQPKDSLCKYSGPWCGKCQPLTMVYESESESL